MPWKWNMSETTPPRLDPIDAILERIRTARPASSIPLLTSGAVLVAASPVLTVESPGLHELLSHVVGPLSLALLAMFYRAREQRHGQSVDRISFVPANVIVVACGVLLSAALGFLGLAAVLVAMAVVQRNRYLLSCALGFTVLLVLEALYFFDNRLYELADRLGLFRPDDGYFSAAPAIVYAAFGLLLLTAGFIALTKERRPSR